ncbi:MAG: hypothetical protein FJ265_08265 [Planctomycetes bacterium]|nr:hypothetical protein [Planctomycetota bacterium]
MTSNPVSPALARHIVQRMGETGQPPQRGALAANVGTEPMLQVLRDEFLLPMRDSGRNSSFKLVQAPFGGGKTHFLYCLREIAWQEGFVASLVNISPDACPFDDAEAIYCEVARSLELPPAGPDEDGRPGIDSLLRFVVEDRAQKHGVPAVRSWLHEELAQAHVESTAVRRAAERFMLAVLNRDDEIEELTAAFLRGEKVSASELAPLRVREQLDSAHAFRFLRSLAQLLRAMDLPGVVMLFDEMDRVMSLSVRRRRAIGDNLRHMIDHCGQSTLPSVLWVYAVPPEFMTSVVPEYPALEQRLKGAATFSTTSPLNPIIDLDRMPLGAADLFLLIGRRLLQLYEQGHGCQFDTRTQDDNLRRLARHLGENQLESGTRRTFVKAAVQLLDAQHRQEQKVLTEAEIRALASRSAAPEVGSLEGEEDFGG